MNTRLLTSLLLVATALAAPLLAQTVTPPFPPPKPPANPAALGANLQRTMTLLATSTPQRRNRVRILFYGQSITEQKWSREVAEDLRRRFPHADLTVENRAIGGFSSSVLVRTAEHDVYSFYPDLVIFHVYGGEPEYEELIANIRRRTTAEVLLQSDHLATGQQQDPRGAAWHDRHSNDWLPMIARKYGCEFADIREPWRRYLEEHRLPVGALLSDGVHLNEHGNFLMAELVKPYLRYDPKLPDAAWRDTVRTYRVGKDVRWKNGRLALPFEGNRVDLLAAKGKEERGTARVLIDGKQPSELPELYTVTRPSPTDGVGWPAAVRVRSERPLLVEEWTARVTEVNPETNRFTFELSGSQTGPDGAGSSDRRFVSRSGRVVIEPQDWWVENARRLTGKVMPVGYQIKWQVRPLFVDTYEPPRVEDATREYPTTVAQGLANTSHTLELVAEGKTKPALEAIRIYRPPVK